MALRAGSRNPMLPATKAPSPSKIATRTSVSTLWSKATSTARTSEEVKRAPLRRPFHSTLNPVPPSSSRGGSQLHIRVPVIEAVTGRQSPNGMLVTFPLILTLTVKLLLLVNSPLKVAVKVPPPASDVAEPANVPAA